MPIDPRIPLMGQAPQIQSPLEALTQIAQLQSQRELIETRRLAGEEARRKHLRDRQAGEVWRMALKTDPTTGGVDIDENVLLQNIPPELIPGLRKELADDKASAARLQKARQELADLSRQHLQGAARTVKAGNYDPELWGLELWGAHQLGTLDDATYERYRTFTPDQIRTVVDSVLAQAGGEQQLQKITTVDAAGREVTQFVTPTEGATYPVPPKAPSDTTFTLGPGQTRYSATGEPIASAPATPGGAGGFTLSPGQTRYSATGQPVASRPPTPGAGGDKPSTGAEKRALNFFNRARQADTDLAAIEDQIAQLGLLGQGRLQFAPNWAQSQVGQLYNQAQRAFTEARLRKDSGAAIPEHEFENDRRTYFAQPGDSQTTLQQKARARAAVLASIGFESGRALGEFYGEDAGSLLGDLKTRATAASQDKTFTVTAPDGQTYTFKTAAQAAAFKRRAGIP